MRGLNSLFLHRQSLQETWKGRNNSKAKSSLSKKFSRSPSHSPSTSLRIIGRKGGSLTQRKRKSISGQVVRCLTAHKQPERPACGMLSTINSIVAIKKLLPVIERDRDVQGGLTTGERQLREASWTTEDSTNCKASLGGSSSTSSGTSINTRVRATATTSTITESATALHHRPPVATRKVKTLKTMKTACVRELGAEMCTPEEKKKPTRLQNLSTRRKLVETKAPLRQNTHNRAICNESKSCVKHHNSCIAVGDAATRFWVPQSKAAANSTRTSVGSRPLRGFPSLQPESSPATVLDLQNLKAALHELKSIVLKGQAGLSEELASTQAQVSRLQELCAVTYVSVDDGTRDLALKADQLASWVQLERKLDVGQIRAMMEEVLAAAPRSVSVSD